MVTCCLSAAAGFARRALRIEMTFLALIMGLGMAHAASPLHANMKGVAASSDVRLVADDSGFGSAWL